MGRPQKDTCPHPSPVAARGPGLSVTDRVRTTRSSFVLDSSERRSLLRLSLSLSSPLAAIARRGESTRGHEEKKKRNREATKRERRWGYLLLLRPRAASPPLRRCPRGYCSSRSNHHHHSRRGDGGGLFPPGFASVLRCRCTPASTGPTRWHPPPCAAAGGDAGPRPLPPRQPQGRPPATAAALVPAPRIR